MAGGFALEHVGEITNILEYFISKNPSQFLQYRNQEDNKTALDYINRIIRRVIYLNQTSTENPSPVDTLLMCKLLMCLIENCKDFLTFEFIDDIINKVLYQLNKIDGGAQSKFPSLKIMFLLVFMTCIYVNPVLTFEVTEAKNQTE